MTGPFNLGTGTGFSVKQIVDTCREVTGHDIPVKMSPRRPGDPACLVASAAKAKEILGWEPVRSDIRTVVSDAWTWHQAHPHGYRKA